MSNISGEALAYTATTIAVAISKSFDIDDLNTLSCLFNAIGDSICVITSQRTAIENSKNKSNDKK